MGKKTYEKVLEKLLLEIPTLSCIDLSTWGEPLCNPELANIVKYTEARIPCKMSTILQERKLLGDVIQSQPSQFTISVSGTEENYERRHTGASWETFVENMHLLRDLRRRIRPKTIFNVVYHLYRDNQGSELDTCRSLCSEVGIPLVEDWAYLNPYDNLLDLCQEKELTAQGNSVLKNLAWDTEKALKLAEIEHSLPCLCQRIFPVINSDLSVALCHLYVKPRVASNYLEISMDQLPLCVNVIETLSTLEFRV